MHKLGVIVPSRGLTPRQEYMRQWRANNQARIKANRRAWYDANRDTELQRAAQWTIENRDKDRAKSKAYRMKPGSKERHNAYLKEWRKAQQAIASPYRIKSALRARLRKALVYNLKSGSAVKDLGCTVEELKLHLERQFQEGMTWNNWGEWHIDHIKPLAKFDLSDREQFLRAVHYINLQPLWASENIKKGCHG